MEESGEAEVDKEEKEEGESFSEPGKTGRTGRELAVAVACRDSSKETERGGKGWRAFGGACCFGCNSVFEDFTGLKGEW